MSGYEQGSLEWIREQQAQRRAAWKEDGEVMQAALILLEQQAMRIAELNEALAFARQVIEAMRRAGRPLPSPASMAAPPAGDLSNHAKPREPGSADSPGEL